MPVGTHDWNKFVTPEEVQGWMKAAGISKTRLVHGMFYIPFINKWTWVPDTSVNYAVHAIKVLDASLLSKCLLNDQSLMANDNFTTHNIAR